MPFGAGLDPLLPAQVERVLATARWLRRSPEPLRRRILRDSNLALICESAEHRDAVFFLEAAAGLGARVAHTRIGLSDLRTPAVLEQTARMLGRLYQAVECHGMPEDLVRALGGQAGIPVFCGLASPEHPLAQLARAIQDRAPDEQCHRLVVQAALVSSLA